MHVLAPSPTTLRRDPTAGWQLLRHGSPLLVCGAGGGQRLDLLAAAGGNTLRTWHTTDAGILDEAASHGLNVMVGLSVAHERHGFDYTDRESVRRQREEILAVVRLLRDHPAVLIWGLGNETEGFERPEGNPLVWTELDRLAQLIKAEDPLHPVCTVIAGPGASKLASFERYCPHVDILGVNAYRDALHIPDALARAGVTRPFLLTEFGPTGHWEVRSTPWGVPVEPAGHDKARTYLETYRDILTRTAGRCLGTFAFLWGHKQEVTPTWYGMFLPTGEKTAAVDAMTLAWSGHEPEALCPRIANLQSALVEAVAPPGRDYEVRADFSGAAPGVLIIDWRVCAESADRRIGGDPENAPPEWPGCVVSVAESGSHVVIRTPGTPGPYRLFVYARDGRGGGAASNFPFLVE